LLINRDIKDRYKRFIIKKVHQIEIDIVSFDNVCKVLAEKYPQDFARWLLNVEESEITVLKTELSIEPIRADSVTFLQLSTSILHIEFQTLPYSTPPLPLRMFSYKARLKTQYKCPIIQVVIFLVETDNEIAFTDKYEDETTIHRYQVIRMWEQKPELFLNNPGLLPLAPLTQTTQPETLLSQVASEIAKITDKQSKQNTAAYTEILAGLRFKKDLIRQLLREDVMKESVIYQDILQTGEKKEALKILNLLLNRRFGQIDSLILERIRLLPTNQLEVLAEASLDFSQISDLVNWLNQHSST
jgi:predicted transposase YdaD